MDFIDYGLVRRFLIYNRDSHFARAHYQKTFLDWQRGQATPSGLPLVNAVLARMSRRFNGPLQVDGPRFDCAVKVVNHLLV